MTSDIPIEKRGGRSDADQRKDYLEALERERHGYEVRGLDDRAKLVQEQIDGLTKTAKPKPAPKTAASPASAKD